MDQNTDKKPQFTSLAECMKAACEEGAYVKMGEKVLDDVDSSTAAYVTQPLAAFTRVVCELCQTDWADILTHICQRATETVADLGDAGKPIPAVLRFCPDPALESLPDQWGVIALIEDGKHYAMIVGHCSEAGTGIFKPVDREYFGMSCEQLIQ